MLDKLTCNTLGDYELANVVGVDWNGYWKGMVNYGEFWTCDGYQDAVGLTLQEQADRALKEIRQFWEDKDLFPETTPEDLAGPAIQHPDKPVFANSGKAMRSYRDFETAYIGEYKKHGKLGFKSKRAKRWFEHREDVITYL